MEDKFLNPDFPLPISFIYGADDWMHEIEEDIADLILNKNKFKPKENPQDEKSGEKLEALGMEES